jgi:hypothetical protein
MKVAQKTIHKIVCRNIRLTKFPLQICLLSVKIKIIIDILFCGIMLQTKNGEREDPLV